MPKQSRPASGPPARSRRIRIFESSIEKLGRILAKKWKVKVVFKHGECKTNGNVIYLPVLPDNASQELMDAMQGHLDHETAHVVFTNFEDLQKIKRKDKKVFTLTNGLEDPRIEKRFGDLWGGARVNLRKSMEWTLGKMSQPQEIPDPADPSKKIMQRPWDGLSDFGKLVIGATVYAQTGFNQQHWFMTQVVDADVVKKVMQCDDLIRQAVAAEATKDVVELAKNIMQRLNEAEEPVDYVDPADIKDDDILLPPQSPQDATMRKKQPRQQPQPGKPNVYQLEDSDDEDEDNGKPSGLQTPTDPGAPDENEQTPFHSGLNSEDGSAGGANRPRNYNPTAEELEKDAQLADRSAFLKSAAAKEFSGKDSYLVYTTEGDQVEVIKDGDRVAYKQFMMEANRHVSVIKRKMQRALLSTNISRWEGDKTRGKLNPRSLFRVPIGTSKRVFRQKVEAEDFDTAVLIMIDHSGSMAGHKLDLAAKTAIVLGEVLNQLNIPFSVRGFSTGDSYVAHERFRHAKPAEQQTYKRWGNLWIGVYKEFDELWGQHQHKLINMVRNDRANTYDGESLRYGAQLLLHRPEKRKIMFWLNDGAPCPNSGDDIAAHEEYARDCAKEVEKMVETVAIGICTDAVKRFYTNCAVVYKVDELPTVCLTTLDELLRKGKTLIQQTSGTRIAKAFQ